jgi:hypothetical protein
MAFKGPHLEVNWKEVKDRAEHLEKKYELPTKAWISGLRTENAHQENYLSI